MVIREGSSLYYSLLWTEAGCQQRFIERLNLVQALSSTLDEVQEPQVAQRKIHWWHEELQRMVEGTARHPAVQTCQHSLQVPKRCEPTPGDTTASQEADTPASGHPALQACLEILSVASTVRFTPPASIADANDLLTQGYTARLALLAHALSEQVEDLDPQTHSGPAAQALGKHEQLYRLPQLIHRGHPVFSDEMYRMHGIRPADLAARIRVASDTQPNVSSATPAESTRVHDAALAAIPVTIDKPGCASLLQAVVADTLTDLQCAVDDSMTRQRYRHANLLPLWRLLVLREKQVALWHRQQTDLLRERSTPTPLVKLYWAWRNRR